MAELLSKTITTKPMAELRKMIRDNWNATIARIEIERRKALVQANKDDKATATATPVKSVSRGRGHARRKCGVTGGAVDLSTITLGTLREARQGQRMSPWIANATGRGDVI